MLKNGGKNKLFDSICSYFEKQTNAIIYRPNCRLHAELFISVNTLQSNGSQRD